MRRPREFPGTLPPGAKVVGVNLAALGVDLPAPRGPAGGSPKANTKRVTQIDGGSCDPPRFPLLALDPSSTATGWARLDAVESRPTFGLIRPPSSRPAIARIDYTVAAVMDLVRGHPPGLVAMEWSSGKVHARIARASGLSVLGASQGACRQALVGAGYRVETITEQEWTGSKTKATRARAIRLAHPEYARWADEGHDPGHDTADALGVLAFIMAHRFA